MDDELIDFSTREDEFLDADLKQQALSFAIITAVVGFVFSSWLFLGQRLGPASVILDRRAAEGGVVHEGERTDGPIAFTGTKFRAPRIGRPDELERREVKPVEIKEIESLEDLNQKPIKKKNIKSTVAETSLGVVPEYLQTETKKQKRGPRKKDKKDSLHRLLYPINNDRPEPTSMSSVAAAVQQNIFVLANLQGEYEIGVGLGPSGLALISTAYASPAFLSRVWVDGKLEKATLVGEDPQFGIALIRVDGANFREIPLAPAPPSRGERIVSFLSQGKGTGAVDCRAGIGFGNAGFMVTGGLSSNKPTGAPLFNDRGELVGCHVHSLPQAPGSGIHLAADTAAIYRLVRGYQGSGAVNGLEREAASALESFLSRTKDVGETKRGRVLPGVGLSDFHLGMEPSETQKWLSAPEKHRVSSGIELWEIPAPPVTLYFVNQRLALIATRATGFATPDGLAPGVSVEPGQLTSEYTDVDFAGASAITSGLDVMVSSGKIREFVVKPEISR